MEELTRLIKEDMKPAFGVTEPGAIAFAAASARAHVSGGIREVHVALNSGMYKNAFTCGIPNSSRYGNLYAAALGAVAADASKGLESLSDITEADNDAAAKLVEEGKVEVVLDHIGSEIMIDASVRSETDSCTVSIRDSHTNIVRIVRNGQVIYQKEEPNASAPGMQEKKEDAAEIHRYTLREILEYVQNVAIEEIRFIEDAFSMNLELLEEGLGSERAVITRQLLEANEGEVISKNLNPTAQLLCNGAIEARVLGLSKPAMSITGSGAHGIIAVMPLYAYEKVQELQNAQGAQSVKSLQGLQNAQGAQNVKNLQGLQKEETGDGYGRLLRAAALSYLVTMYIKEYSGKLSAFCGCGIAAGTGMACGMAFLRGADEMAIGRVILNMASGITGMICDGGNHGCTMKGIVAVDAALRAVDLALAGVCIEGIHGINGHTPEDTMRHMGMIASPGMVKTEETIVEIMEQK